VGPQTFSWGPLSRKFLNFSFQNGAFWCTLYFWATAGPPNLAGPEVAYPPTPPSRRACGRLLYDARMQPKNSDNGISVQAECGLNRGKAFRLFSEKSLFCEGRLWSDNDRQKKSVAQHVHTSYFNISYFLPTVFRVHRMS